MKSSLGHLQISYRSWDQGILSVGYMWTLTFSNGMSICKHAMTNVQTYQDRRINAYKHRHSQTMTNQWILISDTNVSYCFHRYSNNEHVSWKRRDLVNMRLQVESFLASFPFCNLLPPRRYDHVTGVGRILSRALRE